MTFLRNFGRFWYDFIVGDDWRLAAGVIVLISIVGVSAHDGADVWWLVPLGVTALLAASVLLAARRARRA